MGNPVGPSNALLTVFDKRGLPDLARGLAGLGVSLVSTGGTAKLLRSEGLTVRDVSELTGFPEMLDGRVKTLHPNVLAGVLARRDRGDHADALETHGILPIDFVVVNLYPFEETVAKGADLDGVLENIDVGGPTLLRAAAKNYRDVVVLSDPDQYAPTLAELTANGNLSLRTRETLASAAFGLTARYDAIIDQYFRRRILDSDFPHHLTLSFEKVQDLRYGENSHQRAAFYRGKPTKEPSVVDARQRHGKELSYNNILDVDTALEAVKEFDRPTCVIIKHATPCGIACADTLHEAWRDAFACDTYSPFGGVVAVNRELDAAAGEEMSKLFLEVIAAPSFSTDALELLTKKKSLRLLEVPELTARGHYGGLQYRSIVGGLVVQDRDILEPDVSKWKVVTKAAPTPEQLATMLFAFKAVRHVRSNSIVFAKGERTVAIGGGQTSRVDATWIATKKGGESIRGSVLASDAFFPFRDGVDVAAEAGVVAIVQPGGSIRDEEVIRAADEHGISMVFTGQRCFRH